MQTPMQTMQTMQTFARRRRLLLDRIGDGGVAVIGGRKVLSRNSDSEYRFRQPSDLWFLTGFTEPEALCVLKPGAKEEFTLFVRPRDPERETWTGRRAGVEGARTQFKADAAFSIAEVDKELVRLVDGAHELLYLHGDDAELDSLMVRTLETLRQGQRRSLRAPTLIRDLRSVLHEIRLFKDDEALATLKRAVVVTAEAHRAAMKQAHSGVREYEIEALIDYTFRRKGGLPGYSTIVGGGDNATILHYIENSEPLKKGELLLIDAGCEIDGFTADVTRTFPIDAEFSPAQRALYEVVLGTEKRCIEAVKPGARVDEIHQLAVESLTEGLLALKLLSGSAKEAIEKETYKRFFMHRTSHWLGMDVHDVGAYYDEGVSRALAPNMVLTVEPGLYVRGDDDTVPAEFRGIGIRIEDDVLVTSSGHEILTRAIPKEIDDLEAIVAAG